MKIIFLSSSPLTNVEDLQSYRVHDDIEIENWNLGAIFQPNIQGKKFGYKLIKNKGEIYVLSLKELEKKLDNIDEKDIIVLEQILLNGKIVKHKKVIELIFSKANRIGAMVFDSTLPSIRYNSSLRWKVLTVCNNLFNLDYYIVEIEKLLFNMKSISKAFRKVDFIWIAVNLNNFPKVFIGNKTKINYIHSRDYFLFRKLTEV